MAFTKLNYCLACNSKRLRKVLNLGQQPLANSYLSKLKSKEKKFTLLVNCCLDCTHLQLSIAVNPKIIYENYDYVSGTSKTYKKYMEKFYRLAIKNNSKIIKKNILDIGCNDGSQLNVFKKNKFKTFGVDPAKNLYKISSKNHKIFCDFFSNKIANKINKKFDFIITQNSFAHNPKPISFLLNAKKLMHNQTTLIIQTSQADMCRNYEFDTVYHEHINYFNIRSMMALLKRANLYLDNVFKDPIHGTSYIFIIKLKSNQKKIKNKLREENILNYQSYKKWGKKCKKIVEKIKGKFKKISKNKVAIGYGAAAKANTFLNFSKIKLRLIIDDNKLKQNKFCPGSKLPIKSSDFLKYYDQDILIVPLAWNFYREIKNKVKKLRKKNNDKFVIFYPKFKVI